MDDRLTDSGCMVFPEARTGSQRIWNRSPFAVGQSAPSAGRPGVITCGRPHPAGQFAGQRADALHEVGALAYLRNSRGIGLPLFALLLVPLIFVMGLLKSRGPDAGMVPEAERQFIVVGYPISMMLAIGGQLSFARLLFTAAGG
jgi:hypothetical protein